MDEAQGEVSAYIWVSGGNLRGLVGEQQKILVSPMTQGNEQMKKKRTYCMYCFVISTSFVERQF